MKRFALIALTAAALAGCGGASYGGGSSSNAAATTSSSPGGAMTLYTFAKDTNGKSNCSGACAQNWPPAKPGAKTSSSLSMQKLATITRSDGTKQLALGGKPLYTFVGDKKPGDMNGDGLNEFGGVWSNAAGGGKTSSGSGSAPAPSYGGY